MVIPPTVYKRPDPLIYSQSYLMAQGLAVTWDNPDITLFRNNAPVPSSELLADTDYDVRATVWNGSTEAPAVNMPVDFSFLSFGIGTTSTIIGRTFVDLPVRGAVGHPATAALIWRTPKVPGHYCLQVNLVWGDDANPANNLGQENTNVGVAHSPALFDFPVENRNDRPVTMTLSVDSYVPPAPIDCAKVFDGRVPSTVAGQVPTQRDLCVRLANRHNKDAFPIPEGWTVEIDPTTFSLAPGAGRVVTVRITPPDSFTGIKAFNVNGIDERGTLVGGVTLYVQR